MKSFDGALEDIRIIKSSIGENKNPCIKLSKFLLLVGIINLIHYVAFTMGVITLDIALFSRYVIMILTPLEAIMYLLLLIYFIRIYKDEIKNPNKYYLSFLSIVAGTILFVPLLMFLTRIMSIFINPNISGESLRQLSVINHTTSIVLFCFIVVLAGFILRKQILFFVSVAIFFIFLIILTHYSEVILYSFSQGGSIALFTTYYSLIISVGYIFIATVLKNKCKAVNVNEPN
ncbi:hypothetical protein [Dethiobacter alkaliphilus]|uniref:Uncharacterized protein n=1 Tax=Dethiobacter alkaliphilus AHT 1 TaxID=555088 RepID=C0GI28_DETAL|nr:hypothetical protein [Dethiobacter alkaliphilus]EEG77102.1 hypothetical protein DealDRAFT_2137 [Dethiobacter alkaliphilus AHT 1]